MSHHFTHTLGALALMMSLLGLWPARPAGGVVGDGTPDSCTEIALNIALAGGGTVTFNCGGPKTILLLNPKVIGVDTTIFGGDVITLTGGLTTRLFDVTSNASLVLQHIVLDSTRVRWLWRTALSQQNLIFGHSRAFGNGGYIPVEFMVFKSDRRGSVFR